MIRRRLDTRHAHPAAIHADRSFGERAADTVASAMGSWRFIIIQTVIVLVWIAFNGAIATRYLTTGSFDVYPFILLNLLFSTQAAYAAPVIMMSQNRSAAIDRAHAELAYRQVADIDDLQNQQLAILNAIKTLTQEVHEHLKG